MQYSDLIQLYFERTSALQWYWTLYVVVIGGLLAFSSLRQRPDLITAILVTVLFALFAYKNLDAIHETTNQRLAALTAIQQFPRTDIAGASDVHKLLEPTLSVSDYAGTRNFHALCDVLTIAAIWAMELRRRRAAHHPMSQ